MPPPWCILESDLCPANHGKPEFTRDVRTPEGQPQRHLALHVTQQFHPGASLGLVALRCERRGTKLIPISLSIPDSPIQDVNSN
jgi:hypothetical protein